MKKRRIVFAAAVIILALLCDFHFRHSLRIPDPSPQMLAQLQACAEEMEKEDFQLAYPDWKAQTFRLSSPGAPERTIPAGSCDALDEIIRIVRRDDGLLFVLRSNIITGTRGCLVCSGEAPRLADGEYADHIHENIYSLSVGWD